MLRQVFAARSKFIEKLLLRLTSDFLGGRTGNRQHRTPAHAVLPELSIQGFMNHPVPTVGMKSRVTLIRGNAQVKQDDKTFDLDCTVKKNVAYTTKVKL